MVGLTRTFDIPHLQSAQLADGILYTVIEDAPDGFTLKAFQEPP